MIFTCYLEEKNPNTMCLSTVLYCTVIFVFTIYRIPNLAVNKQIFLQNINKRFNQQNLWNILFPALVSTYYSYVTLLDPQIHIKMKFLKPVSNSLLTTVEQHAETPPVLCSPVVHVKDFSEQNHIKW